MLLFFLALKKKAIIAQQTCDEAKWKNEITLTVWEEKLSNFNLVAMNYPVLKGGFSPT